MATNVMRYPIEYKVEVCECAKNMSVSSAAVIYSLHRSTVNNWLLKYNKSGVNGFVVKRNDTQSAKLDYETLAEIQNFKKYNPKATLRDIKDKFDLDCNISLISRKLNVNPILNKSNKKNCELFLKLHIIKKAVFRNEVRTIYRLSLNTSEGKIIAIGYTKNYTSMNICLFIRHSLASINKSCKKWNVRRIETNIFCIRKNDFDSIVKSRYLTDLKLTSKKKGKKYSSYKHISLPKDINCAIEDTYDRILNNFNSDIIDSSLLTSVYNLDVIKKESVDPKNWSAVPIPNENKKSLLTVLGRIKQTGDHAARNFDYKKAHAEYDKVYKILSDLQFEDKQTVCSILLSKALMYYDREKEQTALMLFSDSLNYAEKNGFEKEMAESCFYIGKINSKFSDYKNAIKYYQKSSDILEGKDSPECLCMYYRVQYMIQIANKNYSNADKISALYLINALRTNDSKLIGRCMGSAVSYLYLTGSFHEYSASLEKSKVYNIEKKNYYFVCSDIINLLNVFSYGADKDDKEYDDLVSELYKFSDYLKLPSLKVQADYRKGIRCYRKGDYESAKNLFERSLKYVRYSGDKELYLSNLYYLGKLLFDIGDFSCAIRKLSLLVKEAGKCKNDLHILNAARVLTLIYLRRGNFRCAAKFIEITINLAKKNNDLYLIGKFNYFYGTIFQAKGNIKKAEFYFNLSIKFYEDYSALSSRNLLKEIEISKASIEALKFEYSDIYKIINKDIVQNKCRITATAFFFYHNLLNCGKNNLQECEK